MHTKLKGCIGELIAATDLMEKGWHVAIPYGENNKYDLIVEKEGVFRRVQVKAIYPKNGVLHVNCRSSNNWSVVRYTASDFEILAAVDLKTKKVYYIPSARIHKALFNLRISMTKNFQKKNINLAKEFTTF